MSGWRRVTVLLWATLAVAGLLAATILGGWYVTDGPGGDHPRQAARPSRPGGPFTMADHRGGAFTDASLRGRPSLVFFGFTSCPEVCPTTLADISGWLAELGDAGRRLQPVFVSVDPGRDDAAALAAYLAMFDARILGLTGTPPQLAATARHFGAYYRRVEQAGGYAMDHSSGIYLLDADGRLFSIIDYHEDRGAALAKLRRLLRG